MVTVFSVSACSVHHHGQLLREDGASTTLYISDGRKLRLVVGPESQPVNYLEGSTVEVWGAGVLGRVVVKDWNVLQGPHGMPVWIGLLERKGVQLGLMDRNSDVFYFMDSTQEQGLHEAVSKTVMVEGYVDGPHRVRVLDYRVLEK
jgi:hypothetical protein